MLEHVFCFVLSLCSIFCVLSPVLLAFSLVCIACAFSPQTLLCCCSLFLLFLTPEIHVVHVFDVLPLTHFCSIITRLQGAPVAFQKWSV